MSEKQKTITTAIYDFKTELLKVINESGLPAAVIEPILANTYQQVAAIATAQLEKDKEQEDGEE